MLFVHGGHSVRRLSVKQSKQSKLSSASCATAAARQTDRAAGVGGDGQMAGTLDDVTNMKMNICFGCNEGGPYDEHALGS